MISKPIIMWYHTQMIGDAISLPIIKAVPSFRGIAMLDADPYVENGYGRNCESHILQEKFQISLREMKCFHVLPQGMILNS